MRAGDGRVPALGRVGGPIRNVHEMVPNLDPHIGQPERPEVPDELLTF